MTLYPIKFAPRFVEKIWGGDALARVVGKPLPAGKAIGESWELFDFPPGVVGADGRAPGDDPAGWTSARVVNGPLAGRTLHELMISDAAALLGDAEPVNTPAGPQFPLLIKFLDARQDLSVQVHPPESYARLHPGAALKNECWHVLDHDAGARILIGTKAGTTRHDFAESIRRGECEDLINAVEVKNGDTFYLPSGTVHALGAGAVVAEVQTPSDTTYRVFDFNRVEPSTGKPRALHVEQALECIDFETDATKNYVPAGDRDAIVTDAPQFTLRRRSAKAGTRVAVPAGEMRVVIVTEGGGRIGDGDGRTPIARGDTILVPASVAGTIEATQHLRWLEATVRNVAQVSKL
jgi:mannose-6-phosphate isomerase